MSRAKRSVFGVSPLALTVEDRLWELSKNRFRQLSILIFIEKKMRKWSLPMTVLGLGGLGVVGLLGVLVGTERGRSIVRSFAEDFLGAPDRLEEWNEAVQAELDSIQSAIDALAQALGARPTAQ
jgi:hypothetical protein